MDDNTIPPTTPRRINDSRMEALERRMMAFEGLLAENTATTSEVKDILITVRTVGKFLSWGGGIVIAVVGAWAAIQSMGIHP